jgi:hypothetical protein
MKISWRNPGEKWDTYLHEHLFEPGQLRDGMNPREFILYLITVSTAVGIAINDKPIWKNTDYNVSVGEIITRALMGEPRDAPILIVIDYNIDGDWIDN